MKPKNTIQIKHSNKLRLSLTLRYFKAGNALSLVVAIGLFLYLNLGNKKDVLASGTKTYNGGGNWSNPAAWTPLGVPTNNMTIVIPSGRTVLVDDQVSLLNVQIQVWGTIQIDNGKKIRINSSSTFEIAVGGRLTGNNNNGSLLEVETIEVWRGSQGDRLGYAFYGTQPAIPLPVELVYFKAKMQGSKVVTEWATSTEINNDYFTLERSADGKNFQMMATVKGAGNSNGAKSYTYTDNSPLAGISYYQLKQTDVDGKSELSKLVSISNQNQLEIDIKRPSVLAVGPNPFESTFAVDFNLANAGPVEVRLMNTHGRAILTETIEGTSGINRYDFNNHTSLGAGIYLLSLAQNNATSKVVRVVKR